MPDAVFHIARRADWDAARPDGAYRVSTLGRSLDDVGFVHCSASREQVQTVFGAVYASVTEPLVVLVVDPARVGSEIRFEVPDGGSEAFPHVYGPIPVAAVVRVVELVRDDAGAVVWPQGLDAEAAGEPRR